MDEDSSDGWDGMRMAHRMRDEHDGWRWMAHDEHEGFGPLHDGWPMLHAVCMRDALTLMRMAHMKRMRDGDGMAWVNIDKRFERIFGWGWGWGWIGCMASKFALYGPIMWDG